MKCPVTLDGPNLPLVLPGKVLKDRVLAWARGPKETVLPIFQALPPLQRNDVAKGTELLYLQVAPNVGGSDLRLSGTHA